MFGVVSQLNADKQLLVIMCACELCKHHTQIKNTVRLCCLFLSLFSDTSHQGTDANSW